MGAPTAAHNDCVRSFSPPDLVFKVNKLLTFREGRAPGQPGRLDYDLISPPAGLAGDAGTPWYNIRQLEAGP